MKRQPLSWTPYSVWYWDGHWSSIMIEHQLQQLLQLLRVSGLRQQKLNMLFQMTSSNGQKQIIEVQTHKVKNYQPTNCIQKYTYMLVRPPRHLYNEDLLDPTLDYGKKFTYKVLYVPFPLSLYQPQDMAYVILYLHGNASCRLQGFQQLLNLPDNVGLACFDFDGCGNRLQKEYISLGKAESLEVDIAAAYLKSKGYKVVGWGRSMGSVSLLLSSQCQIIIADSPYSSLKQVCYQKIETQLPCLCKPSLFCLFPCLQCIVNRDLKVKIGTKLKEYEIIDLINHNKNRSIMFLAGSDDKLIDSKHASRLYQKYEGRKNFLQFQGDHNSCRPIEILFLTHIWIQSQLQFLSSSQKTYKQIELSPYSIDDNKKSLSQMYQSNAYFDQEIANSYEQFNQQTLKNKQFQVIVNEVDRQTNLPSVPDQL